MRSVDACAEVRKPKVGEIKPAAVTADITIDTRHMRHDVKAEWDELKQHDVLFLLTIRPPDQLTAVYMAQQRAAAGEGAPSVMEQHGLQYVRGCEVIEVKDEGACTMPAARACLELHAPL